MKSAGPELTWDFHDHQELRLLLSSYSAILIVKLCGVRWMLDLKISCSHPSQHKRERWSFPQFPPVSHLTVLNIPVGQTWIHGHSSCKGRGRNLIPSACAFSCRSGILLLSKKGRMGIGRQLGDSHIDIQEKLYKGSSIRSYRISYSKGYTFWSHQPL